MNHKWKLDTQTVHGEKPQHCLKCGINKIWLGGDYQCWQYWWLKTGAAHGGGTYTTVIKSFKRPDCKH